MAVLKGVFYEGILNGQTLDVEDPGVEGLTFDSDDVLTENHYNQFLYQHLEEDLGLIHTYELLRVDDDTGYYYFWFKFVHSSLEETLEKAEFELLQDPLQNLDVSSPENNTTPPLSVSITRLAGGIPPVDLGIVEKYHTNHSCSSTVMTADIQLGKPRVTFQLRNAPPSTPCVHFVGLTRINSPTNCIFVGRITKTSNVTTDAGGAKDRFDLYRKNARITSQWWVPALPTNWPDSRHFTNAVEAITWP